MRSLAVAAACLLIPTLLSAQARPDGTVIQHPNSTYASVPGMDFPGSADGTYRFAWSLISAADSAHQITPGFRAPARVLNALADDGVPAEQVHLALVAQGPSAVAMLDNEAYREIHGVDNPNLDLLRELYDNGVELVVCGQTMVGRGLERGDFPDFVKVSRAATAARVILAGQGYVFNPF